MAVRKNPDWSVWLADVWHWARTPPGLYICIIVILAGALLSSITSSPTPQYVPTQPIRSAVQVPRPPQAIKRDDTLDDLFGRPPNACPPGTIFDRPLNDCVLFEIGSENICPDNFDYHTRLGFCVDVFAYPRWRIDPNNHFEISRSQGSMLVKIFDGNIIARARADATGYSKTGFYSAGQTARFSGHWQIRASNMGATIVLSNE